MTENVKPCAQGWMDNYQGKTRFMSLASEIKRLETVQQASYFEDQG